MMNARALREGTDRTLLERLTETGFLASECGLHAEAEQLLASLAEVKPDIPFPLVGLAIVRARSGRLEQAIDELRRLIARYPDCEIAKASLGMLLVQANQGGAAELFNEVLDSGTDPHAVNVAQSCLDLARKPSEPQADSSETLEYFRHMNVRP
ncbi:MAG: hypothetical protein JJU06_13420 [Ectothiorhodospiraceae bacterium]|nr:hypothetical protein [Ectothiorhodospiraceae bacterium]MCH8503873.1 hypothetical protein [Ectothiorhodospiraceae bacterium]